MRLVRTTAVAVGLSLFGAFVPAPAGAAAPRAPLTDEYCAAFNDFFTATLLIEFSVALFEAFSQVPGDGEPAGDEPPTDEVPDAEKLRASYYALLSPKLARVVGDLEESGPKVLEPVFRTSRAAFERGAGLLLDAGLTQEQIDGIAEAEILPTTSDVSEVTGEVDLNDDALETLALEFQAELDAIDLEDTTPKQDRALERCTSVCGTTPSTRHDCEDVLPEAEAAMILDAEATLEDDGCDYVGPEPVDGLTPEIEVVVYDSVRAFEQLTQPVEDADGAGPVPGVGDEAFAFDGFSADGHGISCGRTVVVVDAANDRTIVVALCLGGDDPEVTDDQLADIATGVLERIG